MSFDIFTIFYKPAILLPLPIYIPVNPIPHVTAALESVGPFLALINMAITMDLLLCMVIQRYFTMSNLVVSHPKYLEKSVYAFVFITDIGMVAMLILSNVATGDRLDRQDTITFIQRHIIDWDKLLDAVAYPFITVVFLRTDFISVFEKFYAMFFGISRLFAFILFTYKNMRVIIGTNETPQNRKQHQMIIKLLKFEFYAVLFLIIVPSNLLIYSIAMQIPSPMLPMYCTLLIKLYPSIDTFLTALLMKPYRKFIKKIVCKFFRLKSAKVSDNSSTPYHNNNVNHNDGKTIVTTNNPR
uniref:Uncharacterized protein n=1 Tax=Panagrolaimus sp. ES5 TaxID=591445 RepID=A0AC34FC38_9BILA